MPSPSEIQRTVFESVKPEEPTALDALAWSWVGSWKRARWQLRPLRRQAAAIEKLRPTIAEWSDGQLSAALHEARLERARHPRDPAAGRIHGLALLAEAAHRELRLRPYPVQILAALALSDGCFAEIDTGEGKTLSLALAAAWAAWTGMPVHVITSNDYLAARDAKFLRPFYRRAELSVGAVVGEDDPSARFKAYRNSIAYTTAKEVAADYLRDLLRGEFVPLCGTRHHLRMLSSNPQAAPQRIQTGLHFALVDEADNGLIDEAVTPLIISQPQEDESLGTACRALWKFAADLIPNIDYHADHALRVVTIAPEVHARLGDLEGFPDDPMWQSSRRRRSLLRTALEAREFFLRDQHYVVADGKIVIVDEATGRPMAQRSWQQGTHQMIEAKEGVAVTPPAQTISRISFQEFFRKYKHLSGASGTLTEIAGELWRTYNVPTLRIERNQPSARQFLGRRFFPDRDTKEQAILHEVRARSGRGQPCLVGTRSVEASERLAGKLAATGRDCHVLNARHPEKEAALVALAAHEGRVTIATNMAGRGTDIRLGEGVAVLGGLHVVATEPHPSRRVDRQLFGRCGRQSDPGSAIAIYALDDDLFQRFIPAAPRRWAVAMLRTPALAPLLGAPFAALLLAIAQSRSRRADRRRRRAVVKQENQIRANLGFTFGRKK